MDALEAIIKNLLKGKIKTPAYLASVKRRAAKIYKISFPSNISLLRSYHRLIENKRVKKSPVLEELLRTRPVRSLSGIVNISVLTKAYPCPGRCIFCPLEKGIPKSYVSGEPAVERAKALNYDPYLQVKKRIEMLEAQGHPTDKIELRIIGGTWSFYPKDYQLWFVARCFRACNDTGRSKISNFKFPISKRILNSKFEKTLKKEQGRNEKARHRIVGLSVETRPDFISEKEIKLLRALGATMVELGVQSVYEDVLWFNLRGHGVKETILATKLLKDAGFKVLYQMMPNLPGSNLTKDEKMFEKLFQGQDFQPDLLKIYPCAILKEAPFYKLWKEGKYKPYTEKQLMVLIKKIKKKIPYYVRIQRLVRDIPSQTIVAGPAKISNLRQILSQKRKKGKQECKCIRCREVREKYNPEEKVYLFREDYNASGGKEIFLSFENPAPEPSVRYGAGEKRKLYSLLRLRITSTDKAIIREIHTYGQQLSVTGRTTTLLSPQHRGLGKKLVNEAEKITKNEFGLKKVAVIAGVGARGYFRKLGYQLENTYMTKSL